MPKQGGPAPSPDLKSQPNRELLLVSNEAKGRVCPAVVGRWGNRFQGGFPSINIQLDSRPARNPPVHWQATQGPAKYTQALTSPGRCLGPGGFALLCGVSLDLCGCGVRHFVCTLFLFYWPRFSSASRLLRAMISSRIRILAVKIGQDRTDILPAKTCRRLAALLSAVTNVIAYQSPSATGFGFREHR